MSEHLSPVFEVISLGFMATIIILDLLYVVRRPHVPSFREATIWVVFYVSLALLFGVVLGLVASWAVATEFYAGWLTEYSLSIDNLFIFVIILAKFRVPPRNQQEALMIGIIIALILRAIMILLGAALISRFSWVFYIFGAYLIYTAWSLVRGKEDDEEYRESRVTAWIRRRANIAPDFAGAKFRTVVDGRRMWTPMLLVTISLGATDLMFALDSIPAIFGLTKDPFIVFSTNLFALMGLRQLYFLLGGLLDRLVYLPRGLAFILFFIGVKLVLEALHTNSLPFLNQGEPFHVPHVPIWLSLTVIAGTLVATTALSLTVGARRHPAAGPHHPEIPPVPGEDATTLPGTSTGSR
ncbi:MAG: TerC/Alx family metal homeostasis membrane protein [Actinomycetales bacterium]|jgi:Membrane protein TerC, possibly involved in tellurium resistance|nr:TerC/Alx family metal homeostasis membrane protein [Actinomycetales bacterium]